MRIFDYIAEYNELQTDWSGVMRRLELEAVPLRSNETKAYVPDYLSKKAQIVSDPGIIANLRDLLSDDIRFYEHALARP